MALIAEAAELIEHFQWLSQEQSSQLPRETVKKVEMELGDILIYLIRIADKLGIDLIDAANKKIKINEERYPAEKVRGSSRKYSDY